MIGRASRPNIFSMAAREKYWYFMFSANHFIRIDIYTAGRLQQARDHCSRWCFNIHTKPLDVINANVRAIFSHVCGENTGYFKGDAATKTDIFDGHVGTNNTGSLSSCICGNNTEYLEKDIAMYFQAGLWQQ